MRKGMARDMTRLALSKLIQAMDFSDNAHHSDTLCTQMSPSCDLSKLNQGFHKN